MKDVMLVSLIVAAEAPEPIEQDITLMVGGFLVSGFVVSYEKYLTHHQMAAGIGEALNQVRESEPELPEKTYNFIHLRDAKYYHMAGNPIPGNMGIFMRISLESVHGFSFGKLEAEVK